jgi:hypothetical protein
MNRVTHRFILVALENRFTHACASQFGAKAKHRCNAHYDTHMCAFVQMKAGAVHVLCRQLIRQMTGPV